MKSIQNTTLSCGLLNAPVKIFAANGKEPEIAFSYCTPDGDPVERIYVRAEEQDEREWTDEKPPRRIVEVVEYADLGRAYNDTVLDATELEDALEESLTDSEGMDLKQINVEFFVPLKDLPMERSVGLYYLGPDPKVSSKSFKTFMEGIKRMRVAAIAKAVMRSRQKLLAIYVKDKVVHATVLSFASTVNGRVDEELIPDVDVKRQEVTLMAQLIDSMTAEDASTIDALEDTYVTAKRELVEGLVDGETKKEKKIKPSKKRSKDNSLLESLEQSIKAANKRKVRT